MKRCARPVVPFSIALFLAVPVSADELRLDARTLLDQSISRDIRLSADGAAVEIDRGELFEDDGPAAGFSYKPNEERLSASTWIRKELIIADPRARTATLLVGPGGDLRAIVNDKPVDLKLQGKAGGYWQAYTLPPEALKAGKNEFILHGAGRVWIARDDEFGAGSTTRTRHPNRSAKSSDAGKTWDYRRLGPSGDIDGEYCVRLFLDRHRSRGSLTLPVFDAGNLPGSMVAPPLAKLGPIRFRIDADTGDSGKIDMRIRSGPVPIAGAKGWSEWQQLDGGVLEKPAGRYFQVALELNTIDPLRSPRLKQVTLAASLTRLDDWTKMLKIGKVHNERIVRSSIPFDYDPFDQPALTELRTKYKLDDVVKGAKDEFELITRLAAWSAKQWDKNHLRESYPAWNALEILTPHRDGTPVGGFCQQYNIVFLQACASFGIPGRAVSIGPGDHGASIRGGHEVVEVWSNLHRKWVYVDGQMAWYLVDAESKVPLSLWELRQRQVQTLQLKKAAAVEVVKLAPGRQDWKGLQSWPPFFELRIIPRSNFLEKASPLPLNQGMRGWFWTGHHVWTDADYPASLLYSRRIVNRNNWDWTLNQAHMTLEASAIASELRVHLDTETPGFDAFLARIDGGDERPVTSGFLWKLHAGSNALEVRPRNRLGRVGTASHIVLVSP